MRTYSPKPSELQRVWHVVDADGLVLGRLSTEVARVLRGKHRPIFAPHIDTGDHVIVVNAAKVVMTAGKARQVLLLPPQRLPGRAADDELRPAAARRSPKRSSAAPSGMLPKGTLGHKMLRKLKVYAGPEHPHAAQMPIPLDLPAARRAS